MSNPRARQSGPNRGSSRREQLYAAVLLLLLSIGALALFRWRSDPEWASQLRLEIELMAMLIGCLFFALALPGRSSTSRSGSSALRNSGEVELASRSSTIMSAPAGLGGDLR
ncbi:MAG: hypothetical protein K0V04_12360 [Deltaproteobacteria bacterium]|nr:hypothetical protein [Deltaproteobacteria bacterium]